MLANIIDQHGNQRETWSFSLEITLDGDSSRFWLFLYTMQQRADPSARWNTVKSWELDVDPNPHPVVPPTILRQAQKFLREKVDEVLRMLKP